MNKFLLAVVCILLVRICGAQTDTAFLTVARKNAIHHYDDMVKDQNALYTGSQYKEMPLTSNEYPYYVKYNLEMPDEDFWGTGDIVHNQQLYTNVPVLYDLVADVVITENQSDDAILLVKDKISSFTINNANGGLSEFVHIKNAEKLNLPKDGFYEVVYDGPSRVLTKHTKAKQEAIDQRKFFTYYIYKQRNFVMKNGQYYSVASKKNLLKLLEDQKTAIKAYIRKNSIQFSKTNPDAIAKVAAYYDTLIPVAQ